MQSFNVSLLMRSLAGWGGVNGNLGCPALSNLPELSNNDFNLTMIGAKGTFFPCIKYYNGYIRNGRLIERVVSNTKLQGNYSGSTPDAVVGVANPCFVNNKMCNSSNMSIVALKFG
jgi:hypothetical protein